MKQNNTKHISAQARKEAYQNSRVADVYLLRIKKEHEKIKNEVIDILIKHSVTQAEVEYIFEDILSYIKKEMPITNKENVGNGQSLFYALKRYVESH